MANNEIETLFNQEEEEIVEENQEALEPVAEQEIIEPVAEQEIIEPVAEQEKGTYDYMYSDDYRKSVFSGGTAIFPYGKDKEPIYLNNPDIDEAVKEDLLQKHINLYAPKKKVELEGDYTLLDEAVGPEYKFFLKSPKYIEEQKQKQLEEAAMYGVQPYVNEYNFKQSEVLSKQQYKIPSNVQKILLDNNFALPFTRHTGYIEDPDKTIGLLAIVDGAYDYFPVTLLSRFAADNAIKQSQKKIGWINLAIAGDFDKLPSGTGYNDKTLPELDLLRGYEQAKIEVFQDNKWRSSTEWWQDRIRKKLGVEVPLDALQELKDTAGGFMTKTEGYLVDFAPLAASFSYVMYKNAIKNFKGFQKFAEKFKGKGLTDDEIFNRYIKDKYPSRDTTNRLRNPFKRWLHTGSIKTGMDIRRSTEFKKKAQQLGVEIEKATKTWEQGAIDLANGKISKEKYILLTDTVRDLKFRQLSYHLKGVPKIFKQDAAMEIAFASGAVTMSEIMDNQNYEFLGGIIGGLSLGAGGNWTLGVGRTAYHFGASVLDILSTNMRNGNLTFGVKTNIMQFKPEILRNTKIWDDSLKEFRSISWAEFAQFEKFALMMNSGGPDVIQHIKANMDNYLGLMDKFEKQLGPDNIHLLHQEFAIISMLGPMLVARDAAKFKAGLTSLFEVANPEFLNNLKQHQYLLKSLKEVVENIRNKSKRGEIGEETIGKEFSDMQNKVTEFLETNELQATKQFEDLLADSKTFMDNLGDATHPMWDDPEVLFHNLDNMENFFNFVKDDPLLNILVDKPQYQNLMDDVMRYQNSFNSINEQITSGIKNVIDNPSIPNNQKMETMSKWLSQSLVLNERLHLKQANMKFNKVYRDYKSAEIDGMEIFESYWAASGGKGDDIFQDLQVFWRGNKNVPREFKQVKMVFDKAAERQIRKMHAIERGAEIENLSGPLKELDFTKWFKEKQFALAENMKVPPNLLDNMTIFAWLRNKVSKKGKTLELTFNIQELNKLRGGFQRVEFILSKKNDPSARLFQGLFDGTESKIDELAEKYKDVFPNLKEELKAARTHFKYNYANRYLDKESDIAQIGSKWIEYSQLGKEHSLGPYSPEGVTFKKHPMTWINFNKIKKDPELFRDQIAMNIGRYVEGKGYLINPTSKDALMWQMYVTKMIDDAIAVEIKKNSAKFLNGTYRILNGKITDKTGHSVNTFHDIYKLADTLSFDTIEGAHIGATTKKWQIYNPDKLIVDEQGLIDILNKSKPLMQQAEKLKAEIIKKASVNGALIRTRNKQFQGRILDHVSRITPGKVWNTKNFVEHFIGSIQNPGTGNELSLLGETLIKQGKFKNIKEFNETVSNIVGDYIQVTFGPKKVGGVVVIGGKTQKASSFDFDGFKGWLDDNEVTLRQIMDEEHIEFLTTASDFASLISRDILSSQQVQFNFPHGLGWTSLLSRFYAFSRQVIGARFLLSELALRGALKGKGNFIKEMIKSKDAARVISEIVERGVIDSKIDKDFWRVLTAAYVETAIFEEDAEQMDALEFFKIYGVPIPTLGGEEILKLPAEFLQERHPDVTMPQQTTMYPKGSRLFTEEEHKEAYERPTPKKQMEELGFIY
jgi:hypothetical protein